MKVVKEIQTRQMADIAPEDMAAINQFTKRAHAPEEVFAFEILLCDNDVDRDFERFSIQALSALKDLFLGKTGIFDHTWSATGQKARIFKTEIMQVSGKTTVAGEPYTALKAAAYMLRTDENSELIAEIEGGIKKEVSVGCSVSRAVCSICGEDAHSGTCGHQKGQYYNGKLCCIVLEEPTDAYEWSFVAVPAQKNAGVLKRFKQGTEMNHSLKEFVAETENAAIMEQFAELEKSAQAGKAYMKQLRQEVVKLGVAADCGLDADLLICAAENLDVQNLEKLKKAFQKKLDSLFPVNCQLQNHQTLQDSAQEEAFLI